MSLSLLSRAPFAPSGTHPIDPRLAARILETALASGGEYADLFFEYRVSTTLSLEDGKVKNLGRGIIVGVGIRVLNGDTQGYAYSEDLDPSAILAAARTAAAIAKTSAQVAPADVTPRRYADRYPLPDPSTFAPGQEKLALAKRADASARTADPKIKKVEVGLLDEYREICVVTSDGILAADVQPMIRVSVSAVAEDGKRRQGGSAGGGGRLGLSYFDRRSPEDLGREAARIALVMLDARPAPAGEMPVVLANGDSGVLLHEAVGHGLEADFNRKKTSNYTDQIGNRVASDLCTVVDDATLEKGARGSINIDDEGNEPARNVLIEDGILRGYLHDRISAKHFGLPSAGSGRRQSFHHLPMPRMSNTYLLGGQSDPQDIIKSVSRGIYAVRFSGGQVNISNGDFVFSLTEGYLIEDGKITAPVKGVNLIGNGPDVLTKVSMVGHDFALSDGSWTCGKEGQSVPVGIGTPTVKISSITVGGTEV